MTKGKKTPTTPAIRRLRQDRLAYQEHLYEYEEKGGTASVASALGVDEHRVIKTLIMETDEGAPLIMLMHGDCLVSTKELARQIGVKRVAPCAPEKATKASGYFCGGTSPFGTRKTMPVYVERSIMDLPLVYINGGHRGFILSMTPQDVAAVLKPTCVDVALPGASA